MGDTSEQQDRFTLSNQRARWETETRWYEVIVGLDLLGDWTVTRCWGGKHSHLGGSRVDVVASEAEAVAHVEQIHKRRLSRTPPYARVL